jgi:antitoxin Phd
MATAMATWQVQEAKTRLSEVIERARTEGPQTITRHGAVRAVVLSIEDYNALTAHKPDFKAHLLGGPKFDDFSGRGPTAASWPFSRPRSRQHCF